MYSGQAGIDYLATKVGQEDSRASSHWKSIILTFGFSVKRGLKVCTGLVVAVSHIRGCGGL